MAKWRSAHLVLPLLLLAALGLALRLRGIEWGLPHAGRYYPFHPDESVIILAVERLNPFGGDFLPSFYNYGSLYLLLCRIVIDLAAGYGLAHPRLAPLPGWIPEFARLILI